MFPSSFQTRRRRTHAARSMANNSSGEEVIGSIQGLSDFFPKIDDSHCDLIHTCLTADKFFDDGYVAKLPAIWKEYSVEYR